MSERQHRVALHGRPIGTIRHRNDYTRFDFDTEYWEDSDRAVLGLQFEDNPGMCQASTMRVPPWFSNLLPEGRLREWIAAERGVSAQREMELLLQVGHDLPGAVTLLPDQGGRAQDLVNKVNRWDSAPAGRYEGRIRFSLAGVSLKFSMLDQGERLTIPAMGDRGDWILKLPDSSHALVPRNEYAMMSWARLVGIDTPDVRLYHRDELSDVVDAAWPNHESFAFAVRRFDRSPHDRSPIHIEDFAQVRGFYPEQKYDGSFETVAALAYRRNDEWSLREFARRLTFALLIGNGDSHLKSRSLLYADRRTPRLSPAYDLASTAPYFPRNDPEDFGLKFGSTRRFEAVRLSDFSSLSRKLHATGAGLEDEVSRTVIAAIETWPAARALLSDLPWVISWIDRHLPVMAAQLGVRGTDI